MFLISTSTTKIAEKGFTQIQAGQFTAVRNGNGNWINDIAGGAVGFDANGKTILLRSSIGDIYYASREPFVIQYGHVRDVDASREVVCGKLSRAGTKHFCWVPYSEICLCAEKLFQSFLY